MRSVTVLAMALATVAAPAAHAKQLVPLTANAAWLPSLEQLSVEALRKRRFGSVLSIETDLSNSPVAESYAQRFFVAGDARYSSFLASYRSDGLRLYTRIDIPAGPQPRDGYPVVVFTHGWVGFEAARDFHFSYTPDSMYAEWIDAYAKAGFVVVTPGYRGHGTVKGVVADGRNSMAAWDNATYVSPILYAIDTLNLIEGLRTAERIAWPRGSGNGKRIKLNLQRLAIAGHSQGGDVALIVLATAGKGSRLRNRPSYGSIASGTFPARFTQIETYRPMAESSQAFLSGDGTWTGTALAKNGTVNPHFVFGWPSDALPSPDPAAFEGLRARYPRPTVREAIENGYAEMYQALDRQVGDLKGVKFSVVEDRSPKGYRIVHDPRVAAIMPRLGAFHLSGLIKARISLHFSHRNYYSLPAWNTDLCNRINRAGGDWSTHEYPGNNHGFRLSPSAWFTPAGTEDGYRLVVSRDLQALSE